MFYFPRHHAGREANGAVVRRYRRKRYYTTAQRILIHLSRDGLRASETTQEGVAAAILSGRPTATKWLARLRKRRVLVRERAQVEDHPLPKYAYRLTNAGWREAATLRERLTSDVINVRAPRLGTLPVPMSKVPGLTSPPLELATAVSMVHEGHFDLTRQPPNSRRVASLVWGSGLRHVDRLFGRGEELRVLDAWQASSSRVLLITGLPGIGKSALVASWVQGGRSRTPVFGFEVRRSTTAAAFLAEFGAFLAALGKPSLAAHVSQGVPLDPAFVRRLLARDLANLSFLAVVDNIEQASPALLRLARETLAKLLQTARVKLILIGRRSPRWLPDFAPASSSAELLRLEGLDPVAASALLRHRGVAGDEALIRDFLRSARGHPLLLHLAAQRRTGSVPAIRRYLKEELWDRLSREERSTLEVAAVLRRPESAHVLTAAAGVSPRVLDGLVARNLLERTLVGGFLAHDLVREFVRGGMSESRVRATHEHIAGPLLGEQDPRSRWEGVYHLVAAGRVAAAAVYIDSEGAPLLDSVAAEEIATLARALPPNDLDPLSSCVFCEILGDSLRIRGHIGPALRQYGHAAQVAEARGRTERLPRLLRKMAFLERCRNRYPKALGYIVEARARIAQTHDPAEEIEVLRETALVEQALGELSKAAKHLNQAVDLATDASDRGALSRALLALGSLETRRGYMQRGLEDNLEGLRIAERSGNLTEVAHAHIVVGTTLEEMGRIAQSLHHYDRGLELARLLGNLRLTAYATLNRTGALIELSRFDEAGGTLREAEGYFGILEERDTLALLRTFEGQRQMGLGRWARGKRAWEEGLDGLRRHGNPADLALALKQAGEFYATHGELEPGRARLLEARDIARKLGNATLLQEADEDLRRLEGAPAPHATP